MALRLQRVNSIDDVGISVNSLFFYTAHLCSLHPRWGGGAKPQKASKQHQCQCSHAGGEAETIGLGTKASGHLPWRYREGETE